MLVEIVNVSTAFLVIVFGTFLQRTLRKRDTRERIKNEDLAKNEEAKEKRLERMERTLNKHTRSLSALTRANRLSVESISQHTEDLADLEDQTEQLHTSLEMHGRRITATEAYIQESKARRAALGYPQRETPRKD